MKEMGEKGREKMRKETQEVTWPLTHPYAVLSQLLHYLLILIIRYKHPKWCKGSVVLSLVFSAGPAIISFHNTP